MNLETTNSAPPTAPILPAAVSGDSASTVTILLVIGGFALAAVQAVILLVLAWVLPHNPHMWSGPLGVIVFSDVCVRTVYLAMLFTACVLALRGKRMAFGFALVWMCLHLVWVPVSFQLFAGHGEPSPEAVIVVLLALLFGMPPSWVPIVGSAYWLVPVALPLVQVWRVAVRKG